MLSVEQIREGLKDHNLAKVAESIEVSYRTVYHLMNDGGVRPSQEVLQKLTEYLTRGEE